MFFQIRLCGDSGESRKQKKATKVLCFLFQALQAFSFGFEFCDFSFELFHGFDWLLGLRVAGARCGSPSFLQRTTDNGPLTVFLKLMHLPLLSALSLQL
ncbi:MAG TPA: hypothetical protein ACFCUC_01670 [Desulfobacterales bacterium]